MVVVLLTDMKSFRQICRFFLWRIRNFLLCSRIKPFSSGYMVHKNCMSTTRSCISATENWLSVNSTKSYDSNHNSFWGTPPVFLNWTFAQLLHAAMQSMSHLRNASEFQYTHHNRSHEFSKWSSLLILNLLHIAFNSQTQKPCQCFSKEPFIVLASEL